MRTITTVEMNPDSREEYLPGYTPQFPHIASHIDGRLYQSDVAPWHWHESVELFYVRRGSILYRTPHAEHVVHAGCGGMVNSHILHTTKFSTHRWIWLCTFFRPRWWRVWRAARWSSATSAR